MEIEIKGYIVQIDEEDYDRVAGRKWHLASKPQDLRAGNIYFGSYVRKLEQAVVMSDKTTLHRFILKQYPSNGLCIDHISGDTLDNRKANLRVCSYAENSHNMSKMEHNSTGYKGIVSHMGKYAANIHAEDRSVYLGRYDTPEEAAKAYDMAAIHYFKDYARTNFPKENYTPEAINELVEQIRLRKITPVKRKYHFVEHHHQNKSWVVRMKVDNKIKYFGSYKTIDAAAKAADKYAILYGKDKAFLNFPEEVQV